MAAKDNDAALEELVEKVDKLAEELATIKEELSALDTLSDLKDAIKELKSSSEDASKKIEKVSNAVDGMTEPMKAITDTSETDVIIKKIDDILLSLTDADVVAKKLDDLQGYIAGLSTIEEKVQDLSNQFNETNEIVGIIVRQLDDIERKYNQSIDQISDTADTVTKIMESVSLTNQTSDRKPTGKKLAKDADEEEKEEEESPKEKPTVSKANLPSTIEALMNQLLELVNPQTEATEMAEALEEVRDELTTMIKGSTPVLFQFGKRARELKSYPPTATLNENDIATLNKEIKSWASKLKEIAKSS